MESINPLIVKASAGEIHSRVSVALTLPDVDTETNTCRHTHTNRHRDAAGHTCPDGHMDWKSHLLFVRCLQRVINVCLVSQRTSSSMLPAFTWAALLTQTRPDTHRHRDKQLLNAAHCIVIHYKILQPFPPPLVQKLRLSLPHTLNSMQLNLRWQLSGSNL